MSGEATNTNRGKRGQADMVVEPSDERPTFRSSVSRGDLVGLIENDADWTWETDADHRYIFVSEGFERVSGLSASSIIGRSRTEALLPLAAFDPAVAGHVAAMRLCAPFRDFLQEIRGPNSDCRWIAVSGTPRYAKGGRFAGYRGVARNVTGLLAKGASMGGRAPAGSASELEAAQNRAAQLLFDIERTIDSMNMGVVLLDADMNTEIVNRAFFDIWSIPPAVMTRGCAFREFMDYNRYNGIYQIPDGEWDEYVESRLAEIRSGDVAPREFRRADGRTLIYAVTGLSGGKRLVSYFDITTMKSREAELGSALERAQLADAVVNGIESPVFVKDSELRFVFANRAFSSVFDLEPEEILGRTASDFVSEEEAESFEETERAVLATGAPYEAEEVFEEGGITRHRIVRKTRIRMKGGKDYVAGFLFDVTDTKKREVEAQTARRQLAHVLETLPAGVVIYDSEDRFILSNREIHRTLPDLADLMVPGRPLRQVIERAHDVGYFRVSGDPRLDALYDTDREAWVNGYLARYTSTHSVSERQSPDGRWYQVYDTRTEDGMFVGVRIDITELKMREEALRRSTRENEVFRNLIDNVPVAIYAKHPDLTLFYVNQGWSSLTGIPASEAIGRTDEEVFGDQGRSFMEVDREVLRDGRMQEVEERTVGPDGTERFQIARKSSMIASDGSLYLIGSTTDVTEMRRREEELRVAQERAVLADRAKSEFLANMSHEIRTPMNGVLGMAELLSKSDLDPKQKTFTDIIMKSGNALLTIINDILDFSKIDAGQLVLDPAPFNLAEAIEDVATLMSTRAKEKDLELIVRVDPGLPRDVLGDAGRFRQIVTNLLGNAVKFTEHGHVLVDISGEVKDGHAMLDASVTDTGIGIPADKLDQIFEKFSQVDGTSTRRHEGTGLGLAITSRLVEMMGGTIKVESVEGAGSTFRFRVALPVAGAAQTPRIAPVDVSGARILVVDDNAVNRAILMEQMKSWGFDACAAESGPLGLEVLRHAAALDLGVDCVVLDYQMPGMTGSDVVAAMRSSPDIADVPVVMLTSVDQAMSSAQHRHLGVGAQLIKPARSSALLEALVAEIQKHRVRFNRVAPEDSRPRATVAVKEEPPAPAPREPAPKHQAAVRPSPRRLDILVAEDNEVNQLVFAQILGETGYTFEIVRNGRLAVESHARMEPGLILMDVSMPEMNGIEATGRIREREGDTGRHVPIIGVTAHALKGDRERCLEAGMDDYLPKPISPNALLRKLDHWLGDEREGQRSSG